MDVSQLVQQKLTELALEQRDLSDAAEVTESYISQLLSRKKMPPAPERTDIYDKLGRFLKLPAGKLAGLADVQRRQELSKKLQSPPVPLFKEVRELLLGKCNREKRRPVRAIFEKEPFGELERLITQKLLDVVKSLAREELNRESWLRLVARESGRTYKQVRVAVLEFLDTDMFNSHSFHISRHFVGFQKDRLPGRQRGGGGRHQLRRNRLTRGQEILQ